MAEEPFRPPYPGYDVLSKWDSPSWNDLTRRVIGHRLRNAPPRHFLTEAEWWLLDAACNRLVPQPERARPIPIVPWIDSMLHADSGPGFRLVNEPPLRIFWRQGIAATEDEAHLKHRRVFADLDAAGQDEVLAAIQRGETRSRMWKGLDPRRFFETLLTEAAKIYYSHPDAWSEIGFGGPASPRGYVRLDLGRVDPWEAPPHGR